MISKEIEYKAEVLKIAGFALLSPWGRLFFEPIALLKECGVYFLVYLIISFVLAILGLKFIVRGSKLLNLNRRK